MRTPILETERIILRPLSVNDAETIYRNWTSDEEVAKFMIWTTHSSVEVTKEWLKVEEQNIELDSNYTWGFVLKSNGELFDPEVSALMSISGCMSWDTIL